MNINYQSNKYAINYQSMHPKQKLSFLSAKINHRITIKINNDIIKQVPSVKFLGVTLDQKLTWSNHINSVLKSITKSTGMIAKLRHYTSKNTLKLIYYALVYPYLTYGNLVWGNTYPTRLQKLLKIQKKIVRLMCFKSYTDHSEPLFLV
jgi:hypothetical protein